MSSTQTVRINCPGCNASCVEQPSSSLKPNGHLEQYEAFPCEECFGEGFKVVMRFTGPVPARGIRTVRTTGGTWEYNAWLETKSSADQPSDG